MRRRIAMLGLFGVLLGGSLGAAVLPTGASKAASSNSTFIVPADDSYGVAECVSSSCGKVVADQWCAAQGYARATSFGIADPAEITSSVDSRGSGRADKRPISISCE